LVQILDARSIFSRKKGFEKARKGGRGIGARSVNTCPANNRKKLQSKKLETAMIAGQAPKKIEVWQQGKAAICFIQEKEKEEDGYQAKKGVRVPLSEKDKKIPINLLKGAMTRRTVNP